MVALMELMEVEDNQIKLLNDYLKEKPNHPIQRQLDVIKAERRKMPDHFQISQDKETGKGKMGQYTVLSMNLWHVLWIRL